MKENAKCNFMQPLIAVRPSKKRRERLVCYLSVEVEKASGRSGAERKRNIRFGGSAEGTAIRLSQSRVSSGKSMHRQQPTSPHSTTCSMSFVQEGGGAASLTD